MTTLHRFYLLCLLALLISHPASAFFGPPSVEPEGTPCDLCGTVNSEWISTVSMINNGISANLSTPGPSVGGCTQHIVFDAYQAILKKGVFQKFSLKPGFTSSAQTEFWKIWIDVNHDGDFDDTGDLVYASTAGSSGTVLDSFFIPLTVAEGPALMRVAMRRGSLPPDCGNYSNGQVITYNKVYIDECDLSFTNACEREYIQQVKVNALDHVSACGINGFQDFTQFSTELKAGYSYPLLLAPGYNSPVQHPERWLVWIDLNRDLDFEDAGENVYDSGPNGIIGTVTGTLNIPASIPTATTRMRVKMVPTDNGTPSTNPCNDIPSFVSIPEPYGEAEDYSVKLKNFTLETDSTYSIQALVKDVLIGGNCMDVSNITFTGADGRIGYFYNGTNNVGFDNGLLLATGSISVAEGPNDLNGASGYSSGQNAADDDLSSIATGNLFDKSVLEFDFTPIKTPLTFDYVFASEEYCEYVNTAFSDVFGLFISGPGINGVQNLALIPSTNTPVSINTVNHFTNSGLYVHNTPPGQDNCEAGGVSGNLPPAPPANGVATKELQYDGFTRKMTAVASVIPCSTYHIKMAIADVGDGVWDSGLFLKAGSFTAGGNASVEWFAGGTPGNPTVSENCGAVDLLFRRVGGNISVPLLVSYTLQGSAGINVDYTGLPASAVIIPAGQDEINVTVHIVNDGIPEGPETIAVQLNNTCSCTHTQEVLTILDNQPLILIADTLSICHAGPVQLGVSVVNGVPPYSYHWSTGEFTQSINVVASAPGAYTVTVTDACGTTQATSAQVNFYTGPTAKLIEQSAQLCSNQLAYLKVNITGVGPFTIFMNRNGSPLPPVGGVTELMYLYPVSQLGTYVLTGILDAQGCPGSVSGFVIVTPSTLSLTGASTQATCSNSNDGSILATVTGGQAPYQYQWQGSAVISNIPNPTQLAPGVYSLMVTDLYNCSLFQDFVVSAPPPLSMNVAVQCDRVTISASGGTGLLQYSADGIHFQAGNQFEHMPNGGYTITVQDEKGCRVTQQVSIFNSLALAYQSADPTCHDSHNGSISATGSGGQAPFLYSINGNPGQGSGLFDQLPAGVYNVVVTDNNGCSATSGPLLLNNPAALQVQASVLQNTIIVQASGGVGFLSYSIDNVNFQAGNQFSNIPNGTYTVTVKDANGCTATTSATVSILSATTLIDPILCHGGTGAISILAVGGTPPYQYRLGNGNFQTDHTFHLLTAGVYSVQVKDADGNMFHPADVTLPEPDVLFVSIDLLCNDATLHISGGTAPYQSHPPAGDLTNLPNGVYQVQVTDEHGCMDSLDFQVNIPPLSYLTEIDSVDCFGGNSGSIAVHGTGGCPPYVFSLNGSPFLQDSVFQNLSFGTYSLTVKDNKQQQHFMAVTVLQPVLLELSAVVSGNTVTAEATGGVTPYSYALDGGPEQSSGVFSQVAVGAHEIVATDANGCTASINKSVGNSGNSEVDGDWMLNISPNPAEGLFFLKMEKAPRRLFGQLFDLTGKQLEIYEFKAENGRLNSSLDLRAWPNGTYLLRLGDGGKWGSWYLSKVGR